MPIRETLPSRKTPAVAGLNINLRSVTMSKAKQRRRREIKAEIARGKTRYIVQRGLLAWGVPVYILYLLLTAGVQALWGKMTYAEALKGLFPFTVFFGLVVFAIAGYFVGRQRWRQLLKEAGPKYREKK